MTNIFIYQGLRLEEQICPQTYPQKPWTAFGLIRALILGSGFENRQGLMAW